MVLKIVTGHNALTELTSDHWQILQVREPFI